MDVLHLKNGKNVSSISLSMCVCDCLNDDTNDDDTDDDLGYLVYYFGVTIFAPLLSHLKSHTASLLFI